MLTLLLRIVLTVSVFAIFIFLIGYNAFCALTKTEKAATDLKARLRKKN